MLPKVNGDERRVSREEHIRGARRWGLAIIAVAFLALTVGLVDRLTTRTMTPARDGAGLLSPARP
jgi:hypothetical protein